MPCLTQYWIIMGLSWGLNTNSAFFAYRNSLGRYCGKAADAPYSSSPIFFARHMVKRDGELYPKLKVGCYDNN